MLLCPISVFAEDECPPIYHGEYCPKPIKNDLTAAQYQYGVSYHSTFTEDNGYGYGSFDSYAYVGSLLFSYMQGMSRYAEEVEEGATYDEYNNGYTQAQRLNQDSTDNKAYAVIAYFVLDYQNSSGENEVYWHGDVISGSDWDNNGYIDIFENLPTIRYSRNEIRRN